MIVKLDKLTADQIQALDAFLKSSDNRATVLRAGQNSVLLYEVDAGKEPFVEIMNDGCKLDPDTGYFRVTLRVRETVRNSDEPDQGDYLVLMTSFARFLRWLGLFPEKPPMEKDGFLRRGTVDLKKYAMGAPMPTFARPKKSAEANQPAPTVTDGEVAPAQS